jgi:hypothetical protein
MSEASNAAKNLRDRFSGTTEDRLGKALSDLLDNPLLTGAIGRAFEAREKASQAQEVAMGALNIPSAADIERLTRRLRSVSHRLEGIEDGVHRLDRALFPSGVEARLSAIEEQLGSLSRRLSGQVSKPAPAAAAGVTPPSASAPKAPTSAKAPGKAKAASKAKAAGKAKAKAAGKAKAKAASKTKAKAAGKTKAKAAGKTKAKPAGKAKAARKAKAQPKKS